MKFFNLDIALAIFFNILTNVGFKYASMYESQPTKKWPIFIGALVFGLLNSLYFTSALKDIPLNVASAVFFALTIVGLFILSYVIFREEMNWTRLAGAVVIIAGVILINK